MTLATDMQTLDVLCPMHLRLDVRGMVLHAGPTLRKMCGGDAVLGQCVLDLFEVKRPRHLNSAIELAQAAGRKMVLKLRREPCTTLKGVLVPVTGTNGEMILNLSFGISILDGVRDFALTNADFAVTDLAIEMLYLVEAKTAAMEESYRLNSRLQGAKIAAEEQAFTDTLTGLKNRRALETVLNRLLTRSVPFAVMHIDLDYFKTINDTLGHAAGDHVLQEVAHIMVAETRADDTVARVGGDEFTIVLPNVTGEATLRRVGARIIERLEKPMPFQGTDCCISASIGTVWLQSDERPSMEELLSDADVALYASKNAGRATHTLYEPGLRDAANVVAPPTERRESPA
ncbi:MAG: diguanylate cyclase [Sulfitobacter sp.]